jgi:hypothetical protein
MLSVRAPFDGAHEVRLRDLKGSVFAVSAGRGGKVHVLPLAPGAGKFLVIEAVSGSQRLRRAVALP